MSTKEQLITSNLSIGYPNKNGQRALVEGLDLNLAAGEIVCLLGPNGSGKSTLIRTLAGMQNPLKGNIQIAGKPLSEIEPRERAKRISVVLTNHSQIGNMDIKTYISLGRHPYSGWLGRLGTKDQYCIQEALQFVGIELLSNKILSELSDGERQKVSIARALAQEASIMLLDEPTAFLDVPRKIELMQLLRNLTQEKQLSLLLSTHDLDLVAKFADSVWILSDSGKLSTVAPEELKDTGTLAAAFGCCPSLLDSTQSRSQLLK